MEMNVIFFANNIEHAKSVLTRMLKFGLTILNAYDSEYRTEQYKIKKYNHLLSNSDKWVITEAPLNQFFKVGWASNDYI